MTLDRSEEVATALLAATASRPTYTCPMHAEVKRFEPGNCPICGMTLVATAATQHRAQ